MCFNFILNWNKANIKPIFSLNPNKPKNSVTIILGSESGYGSGSGWEFSLSKIYYFYCGAAHPNFGTCIYGHSAGVKSTVVTAH